MASDTPQIVALIGSATVCSTSVIHKIKQLEKLVIDDLGNRGIASLLVEDDLLKAALSLSHSSSVALSTGFPLANPANSNAENTCYYGETDGPMGIIAIAIMLQALGKDVTLIADRGYYSVLQAVLSSLLQRGILPGDIPLLQYPPSNTSDSEATARAFLLENDGLTPKYDNLVALERSGAAKDGQHYNMRGRDVSAVGDFQATDVLFQVASKMQNITTSGVGDGGNEIGMGKVCDRVVRDVPQGETIACVTGTDYLITTGVSNWGGYAIAVALYLLRMCPIHYRYHTHDIRFQPNYVEMQKLKTALPTVEREEEFLKVLMLHQVPDGVNGEISMSIDGLPFRETHSRKIKNLLRVLHD